MNVSDLCGRLSRRQLENLARSVANITPYALGTILMQRLNPELRPMTDDEKEYWLRVGETIGPDYMDSLESVVDEIVKGAGWSDETTEAFPEVIITKDNRPLPRTPVNIENAIAQLRDELDALVGDAPAIMQKLAKAID